MWLVIWSQVLALSLFRRDVLFAFLIYFWDCFWRYLPFVTEWVSVENLVTDESFLIALLELWFFVNVGWGLQRYQTTLRPGLMGPLEWIEWIWYLECTLILLQKKKRTNQRSLIWVGLNCRNKYHLWSSYKYAQVWEQEAYRHSTKGDPELSSSIQSPILSQNCLFGGFVFNFLLQRVSPSFYGGSLRYTTLHCR